MIEIVTKIMTRNTDHNQSPDVIILFQQGLIKSLMLR